MRNKKNKFSPQEDHMLRELVEEYGENQWDAIALQLIGRNERQCRDRWHYYLSPNVNKKPWTEEEDEQLRNLIFEVGPRWVHIARIMNTRNDIQVKNLWMVIQRREDANRRFMEKVAHNESEINNHAIQRQKKEEEKQPATSPEQQEQFEVTDVPMSQFMEHSIFDINFEELSFLGPDVFLCFDDSMNEL